MSEQVSLGVNGGVATIRLTRPEKKNALTAAMYDELVAALQRYDADDAVRVVVFCGGNDFTAGNDLRDFLTLPADFENAPPLRFLRALRSFSKPVVAGVRGVSIGIGTTMLLHCDAVLASESASFALPFVKLGLVPEGAASLLLPIVAGTARASWYLMTGEKFDAAMAVEMGIAAKVVADADLEQSVTDVATTLAALPNGALRAAKKLLHAPLDGMVSETMRREAEVFAARLQSTEFREAAMKLLAR
ncbi:MAG TPA: enoyl-CoA hydratase-related protein [Verrucomicrobiae bacterium]|jgi:enoyl-CoA hydratase/carnithine racemase|nr:enoyl-CoA hydratase-related protein [Verrucomicrobiae bacterium]